MKRAITLATVLAVLLTTAPPSLAQEQTSDSDQQSTAALAENATSPPDFALEKDGELIVGGDVVIECPSLARYLEQYGKPSSDSNVRYELNVPDEQTRASFSRCEQQAFSTSSDDSSVQGSGSSGTTLPDTGGAPLILLAAGLPFVGAGLIAIHRGIPPLLEVERRTSEVRRDFERF